MRWRKLGLVYRPAGNLWWALGYAHLPTPELLDDQTIRVHFTALDQKKYGRIGYVDLSAADPLQVLAASDTPVLDLGELGSFDDCGAVPSCVTSINGARALYYIGFQRAERVPYMLFTGFATAAADNTNWNRLQPTPILDRTPTEPFSRSAPWVVQEGAGYRMWYWSCVRWTATETIPHYNNLLMHATSRDGIVWHADAAPCLLPDLPDEYALGRPSVVRDADCYRMWFSARSHSRAYAIGYAESPDGRTWTRKDDQAGITTSAGESWDSEMICYPALLDVGGKRLMFYNGNRHGASGFGCAILEG